MVKRAAECDPWMFVALEKGNGRRRKVRVDETADCYANDPRSDIRFSKQ